MIFRPRARIDLLDQYLAKRDYASAHEAIAEELKKHPENFNLLLRQAEILGLAGDRERAIELYRKLAQYFADHGFHARAIAVTNKILRLDPNRTEVTKELAALIARQQEAEKAERERLQRAMPSPPPTTRPPRTPPPPAAPPQPVSPATPPAPAAPAPVELPAPATAVLVPEASPQQLQREREASAFFSAFPLEALEELLSSTSVRSFSPGEIIVREGDPGVSLFLIEAGTVEVRTNDPAGREVVLAQLGPGEFFGEVAVLTGRPRTATIVACEAVTLIEILAEDLERIVAAHPRVRTVLEEFYQRRARATVETMVQRLRKGHE
ncbi:MAG: cyclic nucleotide-binding domain-containing protein [Thermoanaerobaculaceae bacterium]|jgi:hypothetical protein|nr:cyclic nucleotide-binding domain-containing protein [Thermoanaerobaculaceae bacterium]